MTVYRDAEHGVVRAMTLDAISLHKGAAWQSKYRPPGWEPGKSDNPCQLDRFDQLTQDAMTRALLRRVLSPLHWNVLEASTRSTPARHCSSRGKPRHLAMRA